MSKYCVIANLQFTLPTLRSQMSESIKAMIGWKIVSGGIEIFKPHWGEVILAEGTSEDGKPVINHTIRFDNKVDMDELYDMIAEKMRRIPVLGGRITTHICYHDEGGKPCENLREYSI